MTADRRRRDRRASTTVVSSSAPGTGRRRLGRRPAAEVPLAYGGRTAGRHHRSGLRRAGRRAGAAPAGHRRRHDPRAGGRGRRRVARQHLPGRGLRRAVAALLLVLGAQPAVGPPLLRRSPRSSTTSSGAAERRGAARPGAHRAARSPTCDVRRGRAAVAGADHRRHDVRRRRRRLRRRPALRPGDPGPARARDSFAGPAFHSAQWRHDVAARRARGSRWSAPAPARSSSCRRSSTGSAR